MLDEAARAEIEAARAEARAAAPRVETPPDPLALPLLPGLELEAAKRPEPLVTDHIPDSFLYEPSESLAVWTDIWERDVGFRLSSHRGALGRVLVWIKRALAPLWRGPLSSELQRERISQIVMLRHLERQNETIRRHLHDVRAPYSYLRDWAFPDLVARSDAMFAILDQRLDRLESEDADRAPAVATREVTPVLEGLSPVLLLGAGGEALAAALGAAASSLVRSPSADARARLAAESGTLPALLVPLEFQASDPERLIEALRLASSALEPDAPLVLEAAGASHGLLLRALGFRSVQALAGLDLPRVPRLRASADEGPAGQRLVEELNRALEALESRMDSLGRSAGLLARK